MTREKGRGIMGVYIGTGPTEELQSQTYSVYLVYFYNVFL